MESCTLGTTAPHIILPITMKTSVIIPTYNEASYIGACIESIMQNGRGMYHEIIVVDNGCTDNTATVAAAYPGVKVVQELKKGTQNARQRGLMEATGDRIAFFDGKVRVPEGWFQKAEDIFAKDSRIVSISGPFRYYDGPRWMRLTMAITWWLSAPLTYRCVGYMILGGNFMADRKALIDTKAFDAEIRGFGDDTDTARRLSAAGKVAFHMDFVVYSSMRRFMADGFIKTNVKYALNFLWPVLFKRPFTNTYDYHVR